MKILYIGHYKENTGWAQAAKDYILALDEAGVDIVCRNVTLTRDNNNINSRILELEKKNASDCDICIQHILPHHLVGTKLFKKNIAYFVYESTSVQHLNWFVQLQQMDEVWVPNNDLKHILQRDQLGLPIKVIPHAFNTEKYTQKYPDLNIPSLNGKYKFYYIGDLNERKNIRSIIRCFHSEFDKSENVSLVLKVRKFGMSPDQIRNYVAEIIKEEKEKLRIYKNIDEYIKDVIISEDLNDSQICSLHQYCDCFVCPSHGEAWSIPSFDAMAFGNTPICSNYGGTKEFIDDSQMNTGVCVDGILSSCQCPDAAFPDIFTGKEYWFTPCEMQIRQAMRMYYEKKDNKLEAKKAGLTQAKKFSYQKIAVAIKEALGESNV